MYFTKELTLAVASFWMVATVRLSKAGLELTSFNGNCYSCCGFKFEEAKRGITSYNDCYAACIGKNGCTAFTWIPQWHLRKAPLNTTSKAPSNCLLYGRNPNIYPKTVFPKYEKKCYIMPSVYRACTWRLSTPRDNVLQCNDYSLCAFSPDPDDPTGEDCCNKWSRGGRAKCPQNYPTMCNSKNCAGGTDHCCSSENCKSDGGPRLCESYVLGPKGTMTCPQGCPLVSKAAECIKSASVLEKKFKGTGCYETEVRGCHDNGPFIYFSTCAKGFTSQNHAAVCKCSSPL